MRTGHMSWNRALAAAAAALMFAFPGTARAQGPSGPEVWAANCGRCHRLQPTNKYDARQWAIVVTHMAQAARLTPDEERAVRAFLAGGAERSQAPGPSTPAAAPQASEEQDHMMVANHTSARGPTALHSWGGSAPGPVSHTPAAEKLFQAQCAPCHGVKGRGDGPVADALQPKPANLTDAQFLSQRTDEQLEASIVAGKGTMPAFGRTLTLEEIGSLVVHIRWLAEQK